MKKPRVRIVNHYARDIKGKEGDDGGTTLPFAKRQAFSEALSHLKKCVGIVPDSVITAGEAANAKRALITARQELTLALQLLSESEK